MRMLVLFFFFFQAEDGIRDYKVTGVQTCALPISPGGGAAGPAPRVARAPRLGAGAPVRASYRSGHPPPPSGTHRGSDGGRPRRPLWETPLHGASLDRAR